MKKHFTVLAAILVFMIPWMLTTSCREKDSDIQAAVETAIKDNKDLASISVEVKDGIATLSGEAKDDMCKSTAETIAGKVKGVKQVVNNCTIAAPAPAPAPVVIAEDDPLTKGVKDAIKDYPSVKADVKDGVVTLTGDIKRADLKKLMMGLNTFKPKKIDNKLTIK